jgi:tripartite-type tricarboxylate transporter receptor subunit TctC
MQHLERGRSGRLRQFWIAHAWAKEADLRPHIFSILVVFLLGTVPAISDSAWPAKPVRVIVPFAAGSLIDVVPRIIFNEVSIDDHQTFIVENRSGAGSIIGAALVAKSAPDGYTILANSSAQAISPFLHKELALNPLRDFVAVAPLAAYASVLVVSPAKGLKNLRQFVDWARANPDSLTVAGQVGAAMYMTAERFNQSAGIEAIDVPFRGAAAAINEVAEGRIDYCFCAIGTTLPYIRSGKLVVREEFASH